METKRAGNRINPELFLPHLVEPEEENRKDEANGVKKTFLGTSFQVFSSSVGL